MKTMMWSGVAYKTKTRIYGALFSWYVMEGGHNRLCKSIMPLCQKGLSKNDTDKIYEIDPLTLMNSLVEEDE